MSVATLGPAAALREILPRERVIDGEAARRWQVGSGSPAAVAFPASTDEAAAVLARASAEGWRVAPAGAGTWLWSGGAPQDVVLSTARMTRVVEYEPADLTITVEAGMTHDSLVEMVGARGQWLPLDPPGRDVTVGGVAATGALGPLAASWGGPRDLALGLRAITGDGRAFNAGGRVVKNVAGFDLVRLLVGSKGTLAFLTEVTMRLFPLPETDQTLVARGSSLEELADAAVRTAAHLVTPAAVELLERFSPLEGKREAVLAVRVLGGKERVAAEIDMLRTALAGSGEITTLAAPEATALWREVGDLEGGADLALRLAIAPARLAELVGLAREVGRMRDGHDELARSPVRIAAHAGTGALRLAAPNLRLDSGWDERWAERIDGLRRTLSWRGGTLTISRAPATLMDQLRPNDGPTVQEELTAGLKAVFDPAGILSVHRFLLGVGPGARG